MNNFDNWQQFLNEVFSKLNELQLDISSYELDHIAYRTTSKKEYESMKQEFKKLGKIFPEAIIRDRRIAIIELKNPLIYQNFTIEALELIEPADGDQFKSGFEHVEFVIDKKLTEFIRNYPKLEWNTKSLDRINNPEVSLTLGDNLSVKFHNLSILKVRKIQAKTGVL